jgi:hypothetical protein
LILWKYSFWLHLSFVLNEVIFEGYLIFLYFLLKATHFYSRIRAEFINYLCEEFLSQVVSEVFKLSYGVFTDPVQSIFLIWVDFFLEFLASAKKLMAKINDSRCHYYFIFCSTTYVAAYWLWPWLHSLFTLV